MAESDEKVVKLTSTLGGGSWNPRVLDRYLAREIAAFTRADIPDLRERYPEASRWIANHFLNSAVRGTLEGTARQLVFGILRRAFHAFQYYHEARDRTLEYLASGDPTHPRSQAYFVAAASWEVFILQVSMAVGLVNTLLKAKIFQPSDGSSLQRIYDVGNRVKHLGDYVRRGEVDDDDTHPLWLTNSGIASFDLTVTYEEAAAALVELADLARNLQDPMTLMRQDDTP